MKKLILLLTFCSFLMLNSFAQVDHIIGVTESKTPVYLKPYSKEVDKLPAGEMITIEDATIEYFTIQYKGGNAYVDRENIKFRSEELRELKKTRKQVPFNPKPIDPNYDIKNRTVASKNIEALKVDVNAISTGTLIIDDKYKYEIDHIRYCTGKYRNEVMTGYAFSLAGTALITSTLFMETDKPKNLAVINKIGYGLGLIGTILIIDSNKWMKKINMGPNGIGIKYVF